MDPYREFILTARNNSRKGSGNKKPIISKTGTGGFTAPGFGAPKRVTKKPTKQQLGKWRTKSDSEQEAYLKKYPNSIFKNVPKRGSIISRSKKIAKSSTAMALAQETADTLKDWGVRGKKLTTKTAHTMIKNANDFLKKDRIPYIKTANENFKKFMGKLSKSDQNAVHEEVNEIVKSGKKPSRILTRKNVKGVLPSLIGLALAGAVFGAFATGFIPPEAIAFIGVKAVDAAWESIKHVTRESGGVTALVTGSIIKDYLNSKDSDDDVEKTKSKIEKAHGKPEENEEEIDPEEPETPENKEVKPEPAKSTNKDLGFEIDQTKYKQDENGNWIRKKT